MKLDFNDILIVPATVSEISSRSEVDVYYHINKFSFSTGQQFVSTHLPIIAAPMDTVVDEKTIPILEKLKINYCIPRGSKVESNTNEVMGFKSYSLEEFISYFLKMKIDPPEYILIDIANGHMEKMYNAIKDFRTNYGRHSKLMVGNVANPETFKLLSEVGADYIRIGIGNGNGCLTTQQTGVGYPMASLIKECYLIASHIPLQNRAKIVADGGMKSYSDIIKALALGADYVMIGSLLNKALDSAGPVTFLNFNLNPHSTFTRWLYDNNFKLKKKFRGMSTKEVQRTWNKLNIKTSEGVSRIYDINYTLDSWTKNLIDYLKSTLSYTDKQNILLFTGNVNIIEITSSSYERFKK
jgi:IMP dehydrogenase/GMP reductase